jgi:hypothetical protein
LYYTHERVVRGNGRKEASLIFWERERESGWKGLELCGNKFPYPKKEEGSHDPQLLTECRALL